MARKFSSQSSTKKEMITNMLLDNTNKSAREIAQAVGTTEGNVFKEKSRLKTTGILRDSRISVVSHSEDGDITSLARAETKTLIAQVEHKPLTDFSPLNNDDLKILYTELGKGRGPSHIIAEYGFNPIFVEYEYRRFCRLHGLNLKSLIDDLAEKFQLKDDEHSRSILQKIGRNGIVSNDDLKQLIDVLSRDAHDKGEFMIIERMISGDSIGNFRPLNCRRCNKPMNGALIDYTSEIGKKIVQAIGSGAVHDACIKGYQ